MRSFGRDGAKLEGSSRQAHPGPTAPLGVSLPGVGFGAFLLVRRLIVGPESEGVFTLFAILFVFIGVLILAVGVVGEYVGRMYLEVRRRPTYRIRAVHRQAR